MPSPYKLISRIEAIDIMPSPADSQPIIAAPGEGSGMWAGAPSPVQMSNGDILLAYRQRSRDDRGGEVRIDWSSNGTNFDAEPIFRVTKQEMNAESLERPWLVHTKEDSWRLYLSCATWGTKHWRVEMLEAESPELFEPASSVVVMSANESDAALKDPVIEQLPDGSWQALATKHPLDDPEATDRMSTLLGNSVDGVNWEWSGRPALAPEYGTWFSRGVRATNIQRVPLLGGKTILAVMFDGRADAESNFRERTGLAVGKSLDSLQILNDIGPVGARYGDGALRYAAALSLADGRERYYYEISDSTGAHEIRTEVRPNIL